MDLDRITHDAAVMGGTIVGQIGAGRTIEQILADYPYIEREDVLQAARYAARLAEAREIVVAAK